MPQILLMSLIIIQVWGILLISIMTKFKNIKIMFKITNKIILKITKIIL